MKIDKIVTWVLRTIGILFLLFLVYLCLIFYRSGLLASSSKKELIENYRTKEKEILELKSFFISIVPKEYKVYIEFSGSSNIDLTVYESDIEKKDGVSIALFEQWDLNPYYYKETRPTPFDSTKYAPKTKSLEIVKRKLKWTDDTFKEIKKRLDKANCISISNRTPIEVGFARSGMGKYSYVLFDNPIPENLKATYNDSCTYILYNAKVALEYGGGAIGAQCFPDK